MEFQVLGPIEVLWDGVPVRLGGPKQRIVLALLVAEAGRTVSRDRLIDLVWGEDPTPGARSTLRTYISNLKAGLGDILVREGGGYRLQVERHDVDALRFEDEVTRARELVNDRPLEASQRLREALALWRGRPFADVSGSPTLDQEARRLEELRVTALEDRVEAELALGDHAAVAGELEALTAEHPFRERFRVQHMLALYRSGRQAEALRAYQKTRTLLEEELGIDPSPALQYLHERILRQEPSLDLEAQPRVEHLVFLLNDIDDSPALWELHPDEMGSALAQYQRTVRDAVEAAGGRVVDRVADRPDAVFTDVGSAVAAAREAQRTLVTAEWGQTAPLMARMAIDVGDAEARGNDYFGPVLNRCGRILAAAHGGQVLLSADAHAALSASAGGWQVMALGEFRFKGLGRPQQLFQLIIEGLPSEFPPPRIDRLPLLPSATFERAIRGYELREQVGGGDLGVVYRAYQPSVGREVAIKLIRPEYANQPGFVRRFEAEAQLVAQLEHPHIVSLYDYWRDPDAAYLVMPWLRGGSLREALDRGPWNLEPASRLLQKIGSALSHAHRRGVIHRDLKPENVLLDEEGNGYLTDFRVAAHVADSSEAGRPVTSSPAYVAPEELRGEVLRVASDIYALGLLTFELLSGRRPPMDRELPSLSELRPDLPKELDAVIARATADDPTHRFASVEEFVGAITEAFGEAPLREEPGYRAIRNPYKGLHAFSEADAQDFYGRGALIKELLEAIKGRHLVAVVGPSGIGKSSAVRAGLIPALRAGAIPESREWLITDMFPGSYPYEELEAALQRVAVERPEGLTEDLARDERGILRVTKRILPPGSQAVLVIDQFEELFTLTADEETRRRFLEALATAVTDERSRVRVVLTLRADFFDRPLRYARFGELLRAGMVAVTAPTQEELGQVITRPAEAVGVRFEPGLVSRIVGDVNDQPGALPLLQYALTELFASRTSDLLTTHGYRASGGVLGALGRRAEELYATLDTSGKEVARQVFLRLVTVDETAQDSRRRVRRRELHGLGSDPEILDEVLRRYGEHRLLSFDRDPLSREPTVEVAHEALLSSWERLAGWISERREDLLLHRRMAEAVGEWERAGRDPPYLLSDGRLAHLEGWAELTDLALTADEREFLGESRRTEDQRRARRRRRRRGIIAGFALATVVSLVAAGLAYVNLGEANRQRGAAVRNEQVARSRELAAAAINVLDEDPELSVLLAIQAAGIAGPPLEAVSGLHEALSNHRVISTHVWPEERPLEELLGDLSPDGRYLAATGGRNYLRAIDLESDRVLWDVALPGEGALKIDRPFFVEDGARLVAGTWVPSPGAIEAPELPRREELGVHVWDPRTGELIARHDVGRCGGKIVDLAGELALVKAGFKWPDEAKCDPPDFFFTELSVLNVATGERTRVARWAETVPPHEGAALSASGRFVAWFRKTDEFPLGVTRVMDLRTGRVLFERVLAFETQMWLPRALSPDGALLIHGDGPIQVWDVRRGELVCEFDEHSARTLAYGVRFTPDGRLVHSAGTDGTIWLWDPQTCRRELVLRAGASAKGSVAMSADGTKLIAADSPGNTFRMWSLAPTLPGDLGGVEICSTARIVRAQTLTLAGTRGVVTAACQDQTNAYESNAYVFDWSSGEAVGVLPRVGGEFSRLSPDGRGVASQTFKPKFTRYSPDLSFSGISIREVSTGEVATRLDDPCVSDPGCSPYGSFGSVPQGMRFSPDGSMLAAVTFHAYGGSFSVWDTTTGAALHDSGPGTGFGVPTSLAFSPDGARLGVGYTKTPDAGGVSTSLLRIFDTETWSVVSEPPAGPGFLEGFTPDGGALVGWNNQGIRVLDIETSEVTALVSSGHEGDIMDLALSRDGSLVGSAGSDGFVRVWDIQTGRLVHEIPLVGTEARNVEFADDSHLVVTPQEGPVLVMTIDTEELLEIARGRVTRGFTAAECGKFELDPCPDLASIRRA